jgi:hypothetical protein
VINQVFPLPIASLDDKGRVSRLETTDRIRAPVVVRRVVSRDEAKPSRRTPAPK